MQRTLSDDILDRMTDHVSPVLAVVFFFCLLLFGMAYCVAKAEEIDGEQFSEDVLYCQNIANWGEYIQVTLNSGWKGKESVLDILKKMRKQLRNDEIDWDDSLVILSVISNLGDRGVRDPLKVKLHFYNTCMEWKGHRKHKKEAKEGEISI